MGRTETTLPAPRDRLLLFTAGILAGLALAAAQAGQAAEEQTR